MFFLFAALTKKSGKKCDKGELYKMIARKYKECMKDMGGRAPGKSIGEGRLIMFIGECTVWKHAVPYSM